MKTQLAIWKQLAIVALLAGAGAGLWHHRAELKRIAGIEDGAGEQRSERHGRGRGGGRPGIDRPVPVIVENVREALAVDVIRAVGDGRAIQSVTLYPKQSGIVSALQVKAGQRVEKGGEILRLDDRQEKIEVGLAEAKFRDAERALARSQSLMDTNAVSQVTLDNAQTALDTARLELERARQTLADRTIIAPFSGVVGIPSVEVGDLVTQSTSLVTLDDRTTIVVEFDVAEVYLSRLRPGLTIAAENGGFRNQVFKGEITTIDSRINTGTRSLTLRAEIPNSEDRLRAGMSFVVTVTLEGGNYPSFDELALRWEREGAFVWRIVENKAEKVRIELIKRVDGRVLVAGELNEGDIVAVEGTQRLRPGRSVTYEEPPVATPGSAGL